MMPRGCTRQHSLLHGCLQGPGHGGPVQLHRPKVASFHHESTNKGNRRLRTLLIMFSYFFHTSPLSTLSSLHSVLANYTCKANRKLNTPTSRDYRGSGALAKCCGRGSEVGHSTGACSPPASEALSHPRRGEPRTRHCRAGVPLLTAHWSCRAMSRGGMRQGRKGCPPSTGTTGWWRRAEEGLCPEAPRPHWPPSLGLQNTALLLWN